ncbi:cytochrome P450 [Rhodococcus globerulus]|uniref:cytochrome P450 n=1 Tax=Rhodococcus globerulus TaxID=33008 RepID=UPI0009321D0A|nr:cytochrome P450 [Rhodococcus globerulus]NMD61355.1 cytochrome P450 [Nocardia globerula]
MLSVGRTDTTAGLTGNSLLLIAESDSLRQDLLKDPALLDKGTEKFLRYSRPMIGQARYIKSDIDFRGRQLKAGDRVYRMYAAANRDPSMFEDPDSIESGVERTGAWHLLSELTDAWGPISRGRCSGQSALVLLENSHP